MSVRALAEPIASADPPALSPGVLASLGTVAGMGALAASSCCALPVALAGLGATGAVFGGLHLLVELRPFLLGGATLALLIGWGVMFRHRARACAPSGPCAGKRGRWRTATLLGSGSILVGLAAIWEPYIEPVVLRAMRG
ncbi:mercuric transporter MerT family protein [Methylobacterium sp. WCS2018Hpa-22]|uniref:mercuric transporter MerT family protein n=1 Tax=Methylobacterium sp. WCS2018Hpa-22 TaxID=3073633 RepID=UPI00288C500D|nr:mercuric transporter MerT family protein [Methylobacterium sp. WCS2018Hpa-22]